MATHQAKSRFAHFLNSPTGPKTVHFWAPMLKWSLVIAGAQDLNRPVEKVSGTQQMALMATGLIWTRWCLIIRPRNYFLASVNFFLGVVASVQVGRVFVYQRSQGNSVLQSIKNIASPPDPPAPAPVPAAAPSPSA